MTNRFKAVIGANYGDEGKGRTVDYLVSQSLTTPLVVRHNSGAQAGHTVDWDNNRHVFSHFGAGTRRGAPTLLGPKFVVHPLLFNQEWDELMTLGIKPTVWVDGNCRVSTPYDSMLNRLTERSRKLESHGSCGVGFGETIQRYETMGQRSRSLLAEAMGNLDDPTYDHLASYYRSETLQRGLADEIGDFGWMSYRDQLELFVQRVRLINSRELLRQWIGPVIFEGAQGLLLHESHANFPHVTRSRTGLQDVVEFMGMAGVAEPLEAYYCTRTYLTRHGNGPFPEEVENPRVNMTDYDLKDKTNYYNEWQGYFRHGLINASELMWRVGYDVDRAHYENPSVRVFPCFAINHANCCPSTVLDELVAVADRFPDGSLIGWAPESFSTEVVHGRRSQVQVNDGGGSVPTRRTQVDPHV